jgi:hypothetical protein
MKLNYTISQNYLDKSYKGIFSCQVFQLNDSITPFTSWLQQNHINDTTAMKLRLCRVQNFCNSWAKGSPFPTWKSTNKSKTYYIIAGRLINKITLLALKCFCTRWDVQLTMADISTKWTAVSTHVITFGQVKLYARLPVNSDRDVKD